MFKKAILQNKKTKEKKEFQTELEFKDFLIWQNKNDCWEIIDLQFKQKPQANNKNTKKVGNGEGSQYYSEKLKCWIFQYYDTDGKRQTMKQKKKETSKDFKARVTEVKNNLNNGTYIAKSSQTLEQIIERHIEQKFKDGITSATSYKRDKETLEQIRKCCSNFIYKPVQKITIYDIENSKENLKQYKKSGIDRVWRILFKGFRIASSPSNRLIPFNIMDDENLKKPISVQTTEKVKPLTIEEEERLNNVLDHEERNHPYRNIVKLELITAMRIGEVLARSKDDINKNNTKLHIHNTLTKDEERKYCFRRAYKNI